MAEALQGQVEVQMVLVDGSLPQSVPVSHPPPHDDPEPVAGELDCAAARLERVFSPSVRPAPAFRGPLLYIESSESREQFERDGCPRDAVVATMHYPQARVHTILG